MDNKNVFIAIALSMSVLLFWAAFFESPRPANNNTIQKQKKTNENVITKIQLKLYKNSAYSLCRSAWQ